MASAFYTVYRENMLGDGTRVDLESDTIKARLVNTGTDYTFSAAHSAMTSVTEYSSTTDATIATSKTITSGVFDAADISTAYSSVAIDGSKTIDALVIYKFVTDDAGSTPLAFLELASAFTPNGSDINLNWNASGIWSVGG